MAEMTIIEAMQNPKLFANWFRPKGWFRKRETWNSWYTFLRALFGLPMDAADLELFRQCTNRTTPPAGGTNEAVLICGRRSGKSMIMALIAVFLAMKDWKAYLQPGETGTIMVIASDRKQARTIFERITALLEKTQLSKLIDRQTNEQIDLKNGLKIEIQTASFRTVRGYTVVAALADEAAFWRGDETSSNPDVEIIGALRPAMGTVPGSMLLIASSPHAKSGVLYDMYRRHYGKEGDPTLVWKAATKVMNPTFPDRVLNEAFERDPEWARAEYQAEFRDDLAGYVDRGLIESLVRPGRIELAPAQGVRYFAFVDPAGGSPGGDSMTLCISHRSASGVIMIDAIREARAPFNPEDVVREFNDLLATYDIKQVVGDNWGSNFVHQKFDPTKYVVSDLNKSAIYANSLGILNSRRVELLDNPRYVAQVCDLERRVSRGSNRENIDHPPGGRDDIANCVAGAILLADANTGARPWTWAAIGESGVIYDHEYGSRFPPPPGFSYE
jgi:hypothetical protein